MPASTAQFSKAPIGGAPETQAQYADATNKIRDAAVTPTAFLYQTTIEGFAASGPVSSVARFAVAKIGSKPVAKAMCILGFCAAVGQGRLHELDDIARGLKKVEEASQNSELARQQFTHLPKNE